MIGCRKGLRRLRLDAVVQMVESAREEADREVGASLDEVRDELQALRAVLEDVLAELTLPPPPAPVQPVAPAAPGGVPEAPGF